MFNNKNIINLIKKKLFCITVNFKQTKLTKDDHWTKANPSLSNKNSLD